LNKNQQKEEEEEEEEDQGLNRSSKKNKLIKPQNPRH